MPDTPPTLCKLPPPRQLCGVPDGAFLARPHLAGLRAHALFIVVLVSWLVTVGGVWLFDGLWVWAAGLLYVAYDTALLAFVSWKTRDLRWSPPDTSGSVAADALSVGVLIAARNERDMLPTTLRKLLPQIGCHDQIVVVDDGSIDDTLTVLEQAFDLQRDGDSYHAGPIHVVHKANGGKASALNDGLKHLNTHIIMTLDADTAVADDAVSALRQAFARNTHMVAACGILGPRCASGASGRFFEWFQTFEYLRAFLSRVAWMRCDALLLVSGAFAGYRSDALLQVGGFRADSRVEDYELIHRMHRYTHDHQLGWQIGVVSGAYAQTDAPASLRSFLLQRKRWFAGFLQTLYAYRDMAGNPRYGTVGRLMLPIKVVDTLQPVFGFTAFILLIYLLVTAQPVVVWVLFVIAVKVVIDVGFHVWSVYLYHRWLGRTAPNTTWLLAIAAAFAEPFSFQLLRHSGALLGWASFLTKRTGWIPQRKPSELP